jgi:hypothetical protein
MTLMARVIPVTAAGTDAWGACKDGTDCAADFSGDCSVDVLDLLILLDNWG